MKIIVACILFSSSLSYGLFRSVAVHTRSIGQFHAISKISGVERRLRRLWEEYNNTPPGTGRRVIAELNNAYDERARLNGEEKSRGTILIVR